MVIKWSSEGVCTGLCIVVTGRLSVKEEGFCRAQKSLMLLDLRNRKFVIPRGRSISNCNTPIFKCQV